MASNTFQGFVRSFSLVAVCGFVGCGGDVDKTTTKAPEQSEASKKFNDSYIGGAGKEAMQTKTKGGTKAAAKPEAKAEAKPEVKDAAKPAADAPK